MTFDEAKEKAREYNSTIGPISIHAGWVTLAGPFTPDMLRAIAKEVEQTREHKIRLNNKLVQ